MARILVSDAISEEGLGILKAGGFEVDYIPDITPEDLVKEIGKYDALVIRSRTNVTAEVLNAGGLPMPMARSLTSGAVMRAARAAEQRAAELDLGGAGD